MLLNLFRRDLNFCTRGYLYDVYVYDQIMRVGDHFNVSSEKMITILHRSLGTLN